MNLICSESNNFRKGISYFNKLSSLKLIRPKPIQKLELPCSVK